MMNKFKLPDYLRYNRGPVQDPVSYARESESASWLCLVGEEFASMPNGMSYTQVQQAVPHSARVVSDPPRVLNLDLARQHVEALDKLPRPTMISCRAGPRASAVAYMYAGLRHGATYEEVIAAAEQENAPFCASADRKEWVRSSMETLQAEISGKTAP
jgi:hypothetical protein